MKTAYFVTSSENKFQEFKAHLPAIEMLKVDLPEIQSLDSQEIIEAKLEAAYKLDPATLPFGRRPVIVEDTGLYLQALDWTMPGPLIKWFMQSLRPDGIFELCTKYHCFMATARTTIGYWDDLWQFKYFVGEVNGNIVEPKGTTTFGWDAIFKPNGCVQTFAEMKPEEKNVTSHRYNAIVKFKKYLETGEYQDHWTIKGR